MAKPRCAWVLVASAIGCASGASSESDTTGATPQTSTTSTGDTTPTGTATTTEAASTTGNTTAPVDETSTGEAITGSTTGSTTGEVTGSSTTGEPAGCKPVTTETFTLQQDIDLKCGYMAAVDVFDVTPAARGFAAARAVVTIEHTQNTPVIHFWNATVVVGEAQYAYGIGDDLCSGYQPVSKSNLGYGRITDAANRVRVPMYQGSSPCTDGALRVKAGSTLTLWYEDPAPECAGKDIVYTSWYATQGVRATYVWQTMMSPILALPVEVPADREALLLSVVEGSPDKNPNAVCGNETQTLVSQLRADGAVLHQAEALLPASGGQGHLVLANEAVLTGAGAHAVDLAVGANVFDSTVRTGGCCGDAAVFAILRAP